MSHDDRQRWDRQHAATDPSLPISPAAFLAEHTATLPVGRTLDLAAGTGRNALHLAAHGHRVLAVDASLAALRAIRARSSAVDVAQLDLDAAAFRPASLDAIVCVNFLDRRLFASFPHWLRPGGMLLLDTFLVDQREHGHPRNPAFLLDRNELLACLPGFRILVFREGRAVDGEATSYRSGVVAELRAATPN